METRWFDLDHERLELAGAAHRFVEQTVRPYVVAHRDDEWSAEPEERVPWELLDALDATGLRTLGLPPEAGGRGPVDALSYVVVAEELARGESSLIDLILQSWKVGSIVAAHADEEVRRHWLNRFASEPRFLLSHCSSEPHGSSDRWLNLDVPEAAMRTTAVWDGGEWLLNGRKQFITNGPDSSLYVVYATTTPGVEPSRGTSSFLVPRDTPGFAIGETYEKMGGRLFNNAELIFEDCRLPANHLLILDEAAGTSGRAFPASKAIIGAQAVGLAQAAYEAAVDFTTTRVQGLRRSSSTRRWRSGWRRWRPGSKRPGLWSARRPTPSTAGPRTGAPWATWPRWRRARPRSRWPARRWSCTAGWESCAMAPSSGCCATPRCSSISTEPTTSTVSASSRTSCLTPPAPTPDGASADAPSADLRPIPVHPGRRGRCRSPARSCASRIRVSSCSSMRSGLTTDTHPCLA